MSGLKPTTTHIQRPYDLKALEMNDTDCLKTLVMESCDDARIDSNFVLLQFEFVPGRILHRKEASMLARQRYIATSLSLSIAALIVEILLFRDIFRFRF